MEASLHGRCATVTVFVRMRSRASGPQCGLDPARGGAAAG